MGLCADFEAQENDRLEHLAKVTAIMILVHAQCCSSQNRTKNLLAFKNSTCATSATTFVIFAG